MIPQYDPRVGKDKSKPRASGDDPRKRVFLDMLME